MELGPLGARSTAVGLFIISFFQAGDSVTKAFYLQPLFIGKSQRGRLSVTEGFIKLLLHLNQGGGERDVCVCVCVCVLHLNRGGGSGGGVWCVCVSVASKPRWRREGCVCV